MSAITATRLTPWTNVGRLVWFTLSLPDSNMSVPVIVTVLEPDNIEDERGYHTYTQSYSIEMQIDDEANATTVLLASLDGFHVFDGVVVIEHDDEEAEPDDDSENESDDDAYACSIPLAEMGDVYGGCYGIDSQLELPQRPEFAGERVSWILLPTESPAARLVEAVRANLRPVLHVRLDSANTNFAELANSVLDLPPAVLAETVVALEPTWTFEPNGQMTAVESAAICARAAAAIGGTSAAGPKILYGGRITAGSANDWTEQPEIDGLFLHHDHFDDDIASVTLEVLEAIG